MNNATEYVYLIFHRFDDPYSHHYSFTLVTISDSEDSAQKFMKENKRCEGSYVYKKIKINEVCNLDISDAYLL